MRSISVPRVALIGFGAIGCFVTRELGNQVGAVLLRPGSGAVLPDGITRFDSAADLLAWRPSLVVECAGHGAVTSSVPALLAGGVDVVVASTGALADPAVLQALEDACRLGMSRTILAAGAIGGLDALLAAGPGGLTRVRYTGTKPAMAWGGALGAKGIDLASLATATTIFEGIAAEAARLFPRNANVAASVALAGLGMQHTQVRLVADPAGSTNRHAVEAEGTFGRLSLELENSPLPENPKTSALAASSLVQAVRRQTSAITF